MKRPRGLGLLLPHPRGDVKIVVDCNRRSGRWRPQG